MAGLFLTDTNVISLIWCSALGYKNDIYTEKKASWYESKIENSAPIISFATVGELKRWAISRKDPQDQKRISEKLNSFMAECHIIMPTSEICGLWAFVAHQAAINKQFRIKDSSSSQINDFWIAAAALNLGLTMLTDDSGFDWMADMGLQICNFQGANL